MKAARLAKHETQWLLGVTDYSNRVCSKHFVLRERTLMVNSQDTDGVGGRFALLQSDSSYENKPISNSASKRRRKKSASAAISEHSASSSTSIDLLLNGRGSLRTVSEGEVLRSNSAEVSSSHDAAAIAELAPARLERHTDAEVPHYNTKRPHASLSFQESHRGLAESR